VVMVAVGQALGQLEAGPLAGGHDPLHDADPFQQQRLRYAGSAPGGRRAR
jgi:hypothetical protein